MTLRKASCLSGIFLALVFALASTMQPVSSQSFGAGAEAGAEAGTGDGDEGEDQRESDGENKIVVFLPRGDGTRGRYGGITPTAAVTQSQWYILDQRARRCLLDGDTAQAINLFKQAIDKAEAKAQYEPGVINSFCGLAFAYHKQGNQMESERLYEYAMRYLEGVSGGRDSARFADYLADIAWLYNAHGKPAKAEVLLKSAITIRERRSGKYSKELQQSLNDYASFLQKVGRETEARHLHARVKLIHDHQSE